MLSNQETYEFITKEDEELIENLLEKIIEETKDREWSIDFQLSSKQGRTDFLKTGTGASSLWIYIVINSCKIARLSVKLSKNICKFAGI